MIEARMLQVIDSRRLIYFYHVAKTGSLSKAEAFVMAPQPVISRHIHKLEEELGAQLLDRNGRGVTLTPVGKILFRRAESILGEMAETLDELDAARRRPAGQVRIAAPATVMTLYMPAIVKRFTREFPEVELTVLQGLTGEIYSQLVAGQIDIGLVMHIPNKARFHSKRASVEPMMCIASRKHPLARCASVTRKALSTQGLVVPSSVHGLRAVIDHYMAAGGLSIEPRIQIDSVPLIRAVVAEGELVSILPRSTCRLEFDDRNFATLSISPIFTRTLYAAYPREGRRPAHVEALLGHVQQVFRESASAPVAAAAKRPEETKLKRARSAA